MFDDETYAEVRKGMSHDDKVEVTARIAEKQFLDFGDAVGRDALLMYVKCLIRSLERDDAVEFVEILRENISDALWARLDKA